MSSIYPVAGCFQYSIELGLESFPGSEIRHDVHTDNSELVKCRSENYPFNNPNFWRDFTYLCAPKFRDILFLNH